MYNYFLWSSVQFKNFPYMLQLLLECTVTDVPVDLHTYIKLFSGMYYDIDVKFDRKEFLMLLYTLFSKDHSEEVFNFGSELFQEYLGENIKEFSKESKQNRNKNVYKKKDHSTEKD